MQNEGTVGSPPLDEPGGRIGAYRLLHVLGEGGMGVVYLAEQQEPVRREVALKVLKPGMDTRQVVARFVPQWTLSAVVAATLAGLPVVLVLTWIFDLNRGGIERTPADTAALLPGERLARRVIMVAGVSLSVLVAAVVAWWILA